MKTATYCNLLLLVSVLALLTTGCYTMRPPKETFTEYATNDKIPLKVAINITEELRQAKGNSTEMAHSYIFPVGPYLAQNAPELARHVFVDVFETNTPSVPVDAVLTLKFVDINRTFGATLWGESIISIRVEWSLADPAGQVIWLDTITGESNGIGFTSPKEVLKAALEDMLTKSQQRMLFAPAICQFAIKKQPGPQTESKGQETTDQKH